MNGPISTSIQNYTIEHAPLTLEDVIESKCTPMWPLFERLAARIGQVTAPDGVPIAAKDLPYTVAVELVHSILPQG